MIDIVILAVLISFAVLGWRRGLVRTLTELLSIVLALILSAQIARAAAPVIVDKALRPATHAAIEQRVDELVAENVPEKSLAEGLEWVVEAIPSALVREHAQRMLDGMDAAAEAALTPTREKLEQAGKDLADTVLDGVVRDLIQSLLCAALCVVLTAVFRLIARVLRVIEKLPGVKQLNELGGALIGLGKGLILVVLVLWVLQKTGYISLEMAEKSLAFGLLSQLTGGLLN